MNFSEALELLKQGKKVRRINSYGYVSIYYLEGETLYKQDDYCTLEIGIIPVKSLLDDSWEEYKEPLLTEEEKEYLKMIIKFSPAEVDFVSLESLSDYEDYDCNIVWLVYRDGDRDAHYVGEDYFKGLKENNEYTLEGLGLKD